MRTNAPIHWLAAVALSAACSTSADDRAGTDPSHPAETAPLAAPSAPLSAPASAGHADDPGRAQTDSDEFRQALAQFARQVAAGAKAPTCPKDPLADQRWTISVRAYYRGEQTGTGEATSATVCEALRQAVNTALDRAELTATQLADSYLVIDFPGRDYSFVEHRGSGYELTNDMVATRALTGDLLRERIERGKEYLLRVIELATSDDATSDATGATDNNTSGDSPGRLRGGVHKYYYATEDRFEPRLHTIYTASWIFTMIKLYEHDRDARIPAAIAQAAQFLLSMQSHEDDESGGAFYYSYYTDRDEREPKLMVGTASKTIFSLLLLRDFAPEAARKDTYLDAATRAADWLITMQNPDGSVKPLLRRMNDRWAYPNKQSTLYTGQVLSALSRIYRVTGAERYRQAARRSADFLAGKVGREGCYVGDDYRRPNPVSSSWLILSLLDYYRAFDDQAAGGIAFRCADQLLTRQLSTPDDIYRDGRWRRSLSSSGNGWLNEVMSELYHTCQTDDIGAPTRGAGDQAAATAATAGPSNARCERFTDAIANVTRLLMQYTYTRESAFLAKSPAAADGGVFWNRTERYVRTDSVCHAMNAYLAMHEALSARPAHTRPEPPLAARLAGRSVEDSSDGGDDDASGRVAARP